jgi:hypothetical protein
VKVSKEDIKFFLSIFPGGLLIVGAFMSILFVGTPMKFVLQVGGQPIASWDVLISLASWFIHGVPVWMIGDIIILLFFFPFTMLVGGIRIIYSGWVGRKYDKIYVVPQELVDEKVAEIKKLNEGREIIAITRDAKVTEMQ